MITLFKSVVQTQNDNDLQQQECIPVGCVPAERWPYSDPPPKKLEPPPEKLETPPPKNFVSAGNHDNK